MAVVAWGNAANALRLRLRRHDPFDPPLKLAAWEHDFVVARQAAHADVGTEADDAPCVTTTWMRLAHVGDIANVEFKRCSHKREG